MGHVSEVNLLVAAPLSPDTSISSTENRPRAQRERRRLIADDETVRARITDSSSNPSTSRERNREDKREGTKRRAAANDGT